jgi:hypothetical protein
LEFDKIIEQKYGNLEKYPTKNSKKMTVIDQARIRTGKGLLFAAWGIEIGAASIGLALAFFTLFQVKETLEESHALSSGEYITIFIAALPFLVIALVELTKIPVAAACYYSTSKKAKYVFGFALFLLSIITFETFLNGFEQNLTARTFEINELRNQIIIRENSIQNLETDRRNLNSLTRQEIDQNTHLKKEALIAEEQEVIQNINNEIKEDRIRFGGKEARIAQDDIQHLKEAMKSENKSFESRRIGIIKLYDQKLKALNADTESEQKGLKNRIATMKQDRLNIQKRIKEKEQKRDELRSQSIANSVEESNILKKYEVRRNSVEENLTEDLNRLKDQLTQTENNIKTLEGKIEALPWWDTNTEEIKAKLKSEEDYRIGLRDKIGNFTKQGQLEDIDRQQIIELKQNRELRQRDKEERIRNLELEISQLEGQLTNKTSEEDSSFSRLQEVTPSNRRNQIFKDRENELITLNKNSDQKIRLLRAQLKNKNREFLATTESNKEKLEPREATNIEEIDKVRERYRNLKQDAEVERKNAINDINRRDSRINEINQGLSKISAEKTEYENKLELIARGNQFYRLAILLIPDVESANDVKMEHIKWISLGWFGSLAAITAWTGTLLAFASFTLRFGSFSENQAPSKINRIIRLLLISITRNIRKPKIKVIEKEVEKLVEVIKEIPVDKVVCKEVPREIIRKEIVHVPIASDDLTILDFKNSQVKEGKHKDDNSKET